MSLVKCLQEEASSSQPAPWQAELKAKKKQPRLAPKPAGKPKPTSTGMEYSVWTTWWVESDIVKLESASFLLLLLCLTESV